MAREEAQEALRWLDAHVGPCFPPGGRDFTLLAERRGHAHRLLAERAEGAAAQAQHYQEAALHFQTAADAFATLNDAKYAQQASQYAAICRNLAEGAKS
jgi:hypothetical protein